MSQEIQRYTTGSAITAQSSLRDIFVLYDPASLVASLTLTMPSNPFDGQICGFSFGGTLAGNAAVVTTLTISANSGQTLEQKVAPVAASGGDYFAFIWIVSTSKWNRII